MLWWNLNVEQIAWTFRPMPLAEVTQAAQWNFTVNDYLDSAVTVHRHIDISFFIFIRVSLQILHNYPKAGVFSRGTYPPVELHNISVQKVSTTRNNTEITVIQTWSKCNHIDTQMVSKFTSVTVFQSLTLQVRNGDTRQIWNHQINYVRLWWVQVKL